MTETVALIGAGAMGGAIGARLLETGNRLAVFDLDADKVAELVAKGAIAAGSAAEAAAQSDYVITSLNSPGIVRRAVFGEAGVADGARPGTIIIDMSSIDPVAHPAIERGRESAGPALGGFTAVGRSAEGSDRRVDPDGRWRRRRRGTGTHGVAPCRQQLHAYGAQRRRPDHPS